MNKESKGLSKILNHIKKRALYYIGSVFIFILPVINVAMNLNVLTKVETTKTTSVNTAWCIIGVLYLVFVSKFLRTKIHEMQPKPIKTFIQGITSLIPVTVLASFITLVQDLINKMPKLDIAKHIWNTVLLICAGLVFQILDSVINRKYLYDLEISKEAKRSLDIEAKKEALIKARQEMGE